MARRKAIKSKRSHRKHGGVHRRHHKGRKGRGFSDIVQKGTAALPHAIDIAKSGKKIYDVFKGKQPTVNSADMAGSGRRRRKPRKSRKSYRKGRGLSHYRAVRDEANAKAAKKFSGSGIFARSQRVESRIKKRGGGTPYRAGKVKRGRVSKRRGC